MTSSISLLDVSVLSRLKHKAWCHKHRQLSTCPGLCTCVLQCIDVRCMTTIRPVAWYCLCSAVSTAWAVANDKTSHLQALVSSVISCHLGLTCYVDCRSSALDKGGPRASQTSPSSKLFPIQRPVLQQWQGTWCLPCPGLFTVFIPGQERHICHNPSCSTLCRAALLHCWDVLRPAMTSQVSTRQRATLKKTKPSTPLGISTAACRGNFNSATTCACIVNDHLSAFLKA